jgi:hypothetical protein
MLKVALSQFVNEIVERVYQFYNEADIAEPEDLLYIHTEAAKVIEFLEVDVQVKLSRCVEQLNSLLPEEQITVADGLMPVGTNRRARKR